MESCTVEELIKDIFSDTHPVLFLKFKCTIKYLKNRIYIKRYTKAELRRRHNNRRKKHGILCKHR